MSEIHPSVEQVLYSREAIKDRVKELGRQISEDYKSCSEITLLGILHGSFLFVADLAREITGIPTVNIDFMSVSSYGKQAVTSGAVKIIMDTKNPIEGKNVIIVEDIIDSGLTMKFLQELLEQRKPKSLDVAVFLQKTKQQVAVHPKYVGFVVPHDAFIVGYGMDYAGEYRCLPYIGKLKPEVYQK
eukprot:TRINITY_DN10322_c0_g1_i1.p1 TRINITY_DN10322_c0_g1~~TRINITY_DN10322_c0_g1_i1.p1  ORF type:complete len:195 (-),score=37.55 TRINITY_DN10322_c0_g1_i1:87-644(-)